MVARSHGLLADRVKAFEIILAHSRQAKFSGKLSRRPAEYFRTTTCNPKGDNERTLDGRLSDNIYYAVLGGGRGGDFGTVTHWVLEPVRDEDYPNSASSAFYKSCA